MLIIVLVNAVEQMSIELRLERFQRLIVPDNNNKCVFNVLMFFLLYIGFLCLSFSLCYHLLVN